MHSFLFLIQTNNMKKRTIITSKVIGELLKDKQFDDWWESKPIAIPLLDHLKLIVKFPNFNLKTDKAFFQEAERILTTFLSKEEHDRIG